MAEAPNWRTSSYTGTETCVEFADNDPAMVMLRDTKCRERATVCVGLTAWASFVESTKIGSP